MQTEGHSAKRLGWSHPNVNEIKFFKVYGGSVLDERPLEDMTNKCNT